jgi:hypothetical protein
VEKEFTFGTLDMSELNEMNITPMAVPGTVTTPRTETMTKEEQPEPEYTSPIVYETDMKFPKTDPKHRRQHQRYRRGEHQAAGDQRRRHRQRLNGDGEDDLPRRAALDHEAERLGGA